MPKGPALPEIELLVACASASSAARSSRLERITHLVDWNQVIERASSHGVVPLAHRALRARPGVPSSILDQLGQHARAHAWNNLQLAKHLVEIVDLLRSHGIAVATFKGPALALDAYGDLTLRQISDLDLLVRRSQIAYVTRVLESHAYTYHRSLPDRSGAAERRVFYNHVFTRDGAAVEAHWRFSEDFFPFDFDEHGIWQRLTHVTILGKSIETLAVEDLILVLAVHGARHGWNRLGWIADIAHLISRHSALDYGRLVAEAQACGVARILAVGLVLASELLEAPIPVRALETLRSDPTARVLVSECSTHLLSGARPRPTADYWLLNLRFRERLRDRLTCCLRSGEIPETADRRLLPTPVRWYLRLAIAIAPNTRDYSWITLPRGLSALYWLVRPIRLALKVVRDWHGPG